MNKATNDIIRQTAERAAREVVRAQRRLLTTDNFRAVTNLLRNYKRMQRIANMTDDEYGVIPPERSKSITVAPPAGTSVRDRDDIRQERIDERRESHRRTQAQFAELDAVVQQFADLPEFVVIRMYYFNEDAHGRDRDPDDVNPSFAQIAEELAACGERHTEKTLRTWRNRLVRDMVVVMFGVDGALSLEYSKPHFEKEE